MNFEMIFSRYIKFVNANSNIQSVQRPVIMKAFEHIQVRCIIGILGKLDLGIYVIDANTIKHIHLMRAINATSLSNRS